jgi:hypothetical protein
MQSLVSQGCTSRYQTFSCLGGQTHVAPTIIKDNLEAQVQIKTAEYGFSGFSELRQKQVIHPLLKLGNL